MPGCRTDSQEAESGMDAGPATTHMTISMIPMPAPGETWRSINDTVSSLSNQFFQLLNCLIAGDQNGVATTLGLPLRNRPQRA